MRWHLLPRHGNLPIPWVTRREGEFNSASFSPRWSIVTSPPWSGEWAITDLPGCERDDQGIWWSPAVGDRNGRPEFSQVHDLRQRSAMDHLRCQVCGLRVKDDPLPWIVEDSGIDERNDLIVTANPPLHTDCAAAALTYCPAMRRHAFSYIDVPRGAIEAIGVTADVFDPQKGLVERNARVSYYSDPRILRCIAKQRIVRLNTFRRLEVVA